MKSTGIIRRIDDLGRIVIPKEIRRTIRVREGDPMEIFIGKDGQVILKKYSPINELGEFAQIYCDSLYESTDHIALIGDRDNWVAVSGASKVLYLYKPIGKEIENVIEERKVKLTEDKVIVPIICEGDPIGVVVLLVKDEGKIMSDFEVKIAEIAAGFLAKQMESD